MKLLVRLLILLVALLAGQAMATTCTSNASGDWKDNVWTPSNPCNSGSSGPAAGSNVVIANGTNVKVDSSPPTVANITINSGGTLRGNGGDTLSLTGNFTNNGTFTANGGTVAFTGTAQTITGNVTFANLTVGASTVLTLAGNVTVTGTLTGTVTLADTCPTNYTLTLANGTVMNSCGGGGGGSSCIPTTVNGVASPLIAGVGNLQLGSGGTVNGTPIVVSGTTSLPVTGTTSASSAGALPALSPATFPAVGSGTLNTSGTVAAGSYGTINASGNPTVFSGGTYYIDQLKATGPIQLAAGTYFINKLDLSANLTVTGAVQLFIGNKLDVKNNGIALNAGGNAGNLQVNLYSGVQFDAGQNNISFTGLIYSPFANSEVKFDNNATITGAVITAGQIQFGNNTTVNYNATVQGQISSVACPVSGPDHYELSVPPNSITCLPTTVTVKACADNSNPCTNTASSTTGTANLAATGGTIGAATLTAGVGTASLSYPTAMDGTLVTVSLTSASTPAANPVTCSGVSCSTTFNTAGFIFSAAANDVAATIPTQVAGTSSGTYYLRAVKTSTTTKACESALSGANTVNFAYECNNPTTCYTSDLMSVNGSVAGDGGWGSATTIARNNNGSVSSYTSVKMTFDANGNAPFTFNYSDVGQVTLYASKAAGGSLLSALTGSSNAFVVKPGGFVLSGIMQTAAPNLVNPAAVNAAGAKFVKAGEAFSVIVTAVTSTGSTAFNYGKETTPEGVTLTSAPVAPAAGANPALANPAAFGAFSNGVATGTTFNWGEVGIITLTPSVADGDYLGAGNITGTTSGNVGRFYPDHFDTAVVATASVPMPCPTGLTCPTLYPGFIYSGQPFSVQVFARNLAGGTTTNYDNPLGFSKAATLTAWDALGSTATQNPPGTGVLANGAVAAAVFTAGVATTATPTYTFAATPTAPTDIYMRAVDADNVSSRRATLPATSVEGGVKVVSGRIKIPNVYGSELLPLPITVSVQYYKNASEAWVLSTTDSVTRFDTSIDIEASIVKGPLAAVTVQSPGLVTVGSGVKTFTFNKPNVAGSADICLKNPSWLMTNGGLACGVSPRMFGRVTFGIYKSPLIYRRENY